MAKLVGAVAREGALWALKLEDRRRREEQRGREKKRRKHRRSPSGSAAGSDGA